MWMPTTSPSTSQVSIGSPAALCSCTIWLRRHSKLTGLPCTRGTATQREASVCRPARANSSTSGPTAAQVWFMASAWGRVTRFQTNSPVASMLASVSLRPMLAKPMTGGT